MGLRPANFHEKPSGHADWADGGADPLVRAGRPRPAAGPTISASCKAPASRRGRRARPRGSAPPFPEGGFSTLSAFCPLPLRQGRKQRAVQDPLREVFHSQVLALFTIQVEELIAGQQAELDVHGELPSLHSESRSEEHTS